MQACTKRCLVVFPIQPLMVPRKDGAEAMLSSILSLRRNLASFAICVGFAAGGFGGNVQAAAAQATYASPDEAVNALIDAVRSENRTEAITKVLGPDGADLANSGDPVADEARRAKFIASFDEAHKIEQAEPAKSVLLVGNDEFPFPIPLVQAGGTWHWDTAAGFDEILTRRVGENELAAIEVMRAYVVAQNEYAEREHNGAGIQYARRLMSREGRKDGLYWPAAGADDVSPLGPLVAQAQREGYKRGRSGEGQPAYHGYVYRMLYGQGRNAEGGARDYIVNGRMIGGFALIATPAEYGDSGVMTFVVNQEGDVFQKDLGPKSAEAAARIELFDPDSSWSKVAAE